MVSRVISLFRSRPFPLSGLLCLLLAPALWAQTDHAPTEVATPEPAVENSVVKIFATARYPDLYRPWTKQPPREGTGTGVIVAGQRILTNAHVVAYASQIQVQPNQSGDKYTATVEAYSTAMDLAVLRIDDETFFESRPPLPRADTLPGIKDTVMAYGFPTGGSTLAITKGIVSRIEYTAYNFPGAGLRIQIDAAINPGNSGGPALVDNRMIGVAFSRLGGSDNIGYIIPNEEIDLFLADITDGRYDGKPTNFDEFQTLINPGLRTFLNLDRSVEGVVVRETDDRSADYPLKPWDVVTHIGDTRIDNEGMIILAENVRVAFKYRIQQIARDGTVPLTVLRGGETLTLNVPLHLDRPLAIPFLKGDYPRYFVHGPLVFSVATQEFVGGFNNFALLNALTFAESPLVTRRIARPAFPDEELVVVSSPFFPHQLTKGYNNPAGRVLRAINGTTPRNLLHLVTLLRDATTEYLELTFEGQGTETLIFSRQQLLDLTEDILSDNDIRAQGTPDTLAAWQNRAKE
jgi:S1-C subfamily serine protease